MAFDDRILRDEETGIVLDLSHAPPWSVPGLEAAVSAMRELEEGAIANPDEGRQVGHYWLRDPARAPSVAQRSAIASSWSQVAALDRGGADTVVLVGIGGSALGPALLADALANPADPARLVILDNTDPDGIARLLAPLDPRRSLVLVVSKSGGTVETRNGMLAAMAWTRRAGLPFGDRAIAVTGEGSRLDRLAAGGEADDADVLQALGGPPSPWRARLPLWDWVGGRSSITGAVGLAPMQLCGWDWRGFLAGAAAMDRSTRAGAARNPAAWLAGAWFSAGNGRGDRNLVVLPYRDRLSLLGRYLQQLVMESLGKQRDRRGRVVEQGLSVFGNKGSTDQHAFIQQVRDGRDDSFTHFVETTDPGGRSPADGGFDAGDHLLGFRLGTEAALAGTGRPSLGLRLPDASPRSLGALIALFERAVGLYAELIDVNAYDQPGVEAGKLAARSALAALLRLQGLLGTELETADALALRADLAPGLTWRLLDHLAATDRAVREVGRCPAEDRFCAP